METRARCRAHPLIALGREVGWGRAGKKIITLFEVFLHELFITSLAGPFFVLQNIEINIDYLVFAVLFLFVSFGVVLLTCFFLRVVRPSSLASLGWWSFPSSPCGGGSAFPFLPLLLWAGAAVSLPPLGGGAFFPREENSVKLLKNQFISMTPSPKKQHTLPHPKNTTGQRKQRWPMPHEVMARKHV